MTTEPDPTEPTPVTLEDVTDKLLGNLHEGDMQPFTGIAGFVDACRADTGEAPDA